MQRLRRETESAHRAVEGALPLMHAGLRRTEYVACLRQMLGVVTAWEERAREVAPEWMQDLLASRRRSAMLEDDLACFGIGAEDVERAVMPEMLTLPSLLGAMYVMEGSTLGGQLIARHVAGALDLREGRGNAYFRGHGEQTGRMWKEFCEVITTRVADEETDAVVVAARAMFETFGAWMREKSVVHVD